MAPEGVLQRGTVLVRDGIIDAVVEGDLAAGEGAWESMRGGGM